MKCSWELDSPNIEPSPSTFAFHSPSTSSTSLEATKSTPLLTASIPSRSQMPLSTIREAYPFQGNDVLLSRVTTNPSFFFAGEREDLTTTDKHSGRLTHIYESNNKPPVHELPSGVRGTEAGLCPFYHPLPPAADPDGTTPTREGDLQGRKANPFSAAARGRSPGTSNETCSLTRRRWHLKPGNVERDLFVDPPSLAPEARERRTRPVR